MRALTLAALLPLLAACSNSGDSYLLYRNSVLDRIDDKSSRILIATFDAPEPGRYNFENCQLAASLFGGQSLVTTTFWCEKK
jgi:hypothetical protein